MQFYIICYNSYWIKIYLVQEQARVPSVSGTHKFIFMEPLSYYNGSNPLTRITNGFPLLVDCRVGLVRMALRAVSKPNIMTRVVPPNTNTSILIAIRENGDAHMLLHCQPDASLPRYAFPLRNWNMQLIVLVFNVAMQHLPPSSADFAILKLMQNGAYWSNKLSLPVFDRIHTLFWRIWLLCNWIYGLVGALGWARTI